MKLYKNMLIIVVNYYFCGNYSKNFHSCIFKISEVILKIPASYYLYKSFIVLKYIHIYNIYSYYAQHVMFINF